MARRSLKRPRMREFTFGAGVALLVLICAPASAMLESTDHSAAPERIAQAWGLPPDQRETWSKAFGVDVHEIATSATDDILYPGNQPTFTFQITNSNDRQVDASGKVEVIRYQLKTLDKDFFSYEIVNLGIVSTTPVRIHVREHSFANITVTPTVSGLFGGYAIIMDLGPYGRHLADLCIRTMRHTAMPEPFPVFTLDERDPALLDAIGVHAIRSGLDFKRPSDTDYAQWVTDLGVRLRELQKHHITVMEVIGSGDGPLALGQWTHHLDVKGEMVGDYNGTTWMPSADPDLTAQVHDVLSRYGWPKGPITAVCLYNEPWEGGGISGWMSDMT